MLPGPLELVVGSRMLDRSKVIGQTKRNLLVLQVWGFAQGQQQTVTSTINSTSAQDGFPESSSRARMTADCEDTSNSSKRRIRKTGRGQSQDEATAKIMAAVVRRSRGGGRCMEKEMEQMGRPGAVFQSWRTTGRSGGTTLLPYTPPGVMDMSE